MIERQVPQAILTNMCAQLYVAGLIAYPIVAFFVKTSVALVLYRIAAQSDQVRVIRRLLVFSIVIVAVSALAVLLGTCLQCRPLSVSWGIGEGVCADPSSISTLGYFWSTIDILSAWTYAILPIIMLWNVNMSFRMKALSSTLLGLGVMYGLVWLTLPPSFLTYSLTVAVRALHLSLDLGASTKLGRCRTSMTIRHEAGPTSSCRHGLLSNSA